MSLVVAFVAAASFVNAQSAVSDGGGGLSIGVESGFGNVADQTELSITPNVAFENSFFNNAFDVSVAIGYTRAFDDVAAENLDATGAFGFNLGVGESSTLSLVLQSENHIQISPDIPDEDRHQGIFEPSLQWTQWGDSGAFWLQVEVPIAEVADPTVDVAPTIGLASLSGFSLEAGPVFSVKPEVDLVGYQAALGLGSEHEDVLYSRVELEVVGKEFENILVTPEVGANLSALNIYAKAEIAMMAGDETLGKSDETLFSPSVGLKLRF
jgi:hypothetical protein